MFSLFSWWTQSVFVNSSGTDCWGSFGLCWLVLLGPAWACVQRETSWSEGRWSISPKVGVPPGLVCSSSLSEGFRNDGHFWRGFGRFRSSACLVLLFWEWTRETLAYDGDHCLAHVVSIASQREAASTWDNLLGSPVQKRKRWNFLDEKMELLGRSITTDGLMDTSRKDASSEAVRRDWSTRPSMMCQADPRSCPAHFRTME